MAAAACTLWFRLDVVMVFAVIFSSLVRRSASFSVRPAIASRARPVVVSSSLVLRQMSSEGALSPNDFIEMQKTTSNTTTNVIENEPSSYLLHQQQVFDEMSQFFASDDATPPEVVPVMRHLAHSILTRFQDQPIKLLDVGCGTGALFPFYLEAANDLNVALEITGVDLSPKMAALARQRADSLVGNDDSFITVVDSDFVTLMQQDDDKEYRDSYDCVVANACFANFFDTGKCEDDTCMCKCHFRELSLYYSLLHSLTPFCAYTTSTKDAVLNAMTSCLKVGGSLFITHPLGADFVKKLQEEDPGTVPHLLPTREALETTQLPIQVTDWQERDESGNAMYLAGAIKTPYQPLPRILKFRGTVDSGYGRGGKKLGFPTANLPESQFANALQDVSTGVYFGWAVVEGRDGIHKAAVNVGYSPTFEGKENVEKIIEAHLIQPEPALDDFYNETMRLALSGFLRPEQKFDSFPDLMAAITNDVTNAENALDVESYASLRQDSFLTKTDDEWVGKSGGDATASWEFEDAISKT